MDEIRVTFVQDKTQAKYDEIIALLLYLLTTPAMSQPQRQMCTTSAIRWVLRVRGYRTSCQISVKNI